MLFEGGMGMGEKNVKRDRKKPKVNFLLSTIFIEMFPQNVPITYGRTFSPTMVCSPLMVQPV